jgi:GntR family transcriptional regulator of vanillate catabolism
MIRDERHLETADGSKEPSRTLKAVLRLRDMIASGVLPPGERLLEVQLVERLEVSRTPIRAALLRLEQEGLLEALPSGGYVVRRLSEPDAMIAIEMRGTLEGLAARLAAERGASPAALDAARELLCGMDALIRPNEMRIDIEAYVALNASFHALITEMSGSELLAREIDRIAAMPFASPSALVPLEPNSAATHHVLTIAQHQHHLVIEAIEARQGARAEDLMREHARNAQRNLKRGLATGWPLVDMVSGRR